MTQVLVTVESTDTLTNKTIDLASNTLTGTTAEFNTALSDNDFATLAGTETLTNKTINASNNTLSNLDETMLIVNAGVAGTVLTSNGVGVAPTYQAVATDLEDLGDVTITTRAAHQVLVVNAGNTAWVNELLDNDNLASGVFSNITGVGTQSQDLAMGDNSITGVSNAGIVFTSTHTITSGASFLTANVGSGDFFVVNVNGTNEYFFSAGS